MFQGTVKHNVNMNRTTYFTEDSEVMYIILWDSCVSVSALLRNDGSAISVNHSITSF